jgi:GxxExxY protein
MQQSPAHGGVVIAVVLARAGSKGVPGKNVAEVGGRPCVAWTIGHALTARVDAVVVSSDSDEVLEIAGAMGALAHRRSDVLASDTARVDDALREAVAWYEAEGGQVAAAAMLYGNVPVRPAGLLERAVALWRESGCDSVQSYAPVGKFHPWWQCRVGEDGRVEPWEGERLFHGVYRRQELPASYVPDGGVVVVGRAALLGEVGLDLAHPHAFLGRHHRGIVNDAGAVVDIDSAEDLENARARLRGRADTESTGSTERGTEKKRLGVEGLRDSELTGAIIEAAIEVHRVLGPGMLEAAYEACLSAELIERGFRVRRQVPVSLEYKGQKVDVAYRMDLVVEDRVVVELKVAERINPVHEGQLLSHMRTSGIGIGLLLNFNVKLLKDGIVRRVL